MDSQSFELVPLQGFGFLRFGMPPEEIKNYHTIYGSLEEQQTINHDTTMWDDLIKNADIYDLSNHQLKDLNQIAGQEEEHLVRFHLATGIILTFNQQKLVTISLYGKKLPVFLNGQDISQIAGEPLIRHVAQAVGENPCICDELVYFYHHAISLYGFTNGVASNQVDWKSLGDPSGRTGITITAKPDNVPRCDLKTSYIFQVV